MKRAIPRARTRHVLPHGNNPELPNANAEIDDADVIDPDVLAADVALLAPPVPEPHVPFIAPIVPEPILPTAQAPVMNKLYRPATHIIRPLPNSCSTGRIPSIT